MTRINQHHATAEAALAEYLLAQARRELKRYPRSPIIAAPSTAKDIDLSGLLRLTSEQAANMLREAGWS